MSNRTPGATTPLGGPSPRSTQFSSPTHQPSSSQTAASASSEGLSANASPAHQYYNAARSPMNGAAGGIPPFMNTSPFGSQQQQQQPTTQQQQQQTTQSQSTKPDYSRTHFEPKQQSQQQQQQQPKSGDIFADILGEQGYKFGSKTNQGPRSINEMRKEELVKDMDPDNVKIMEWVRNFVNF